MSLGAEANESRRRFTALVLAAARPGPDPLAMAQGVSHKCLVEVGGVPMLTRVVQALQSCSQIERTAIALDDQRILVGLPALRDAERAGTLTALESAETPSRSVLRAAQALEAPYPLLVTTADHALLTAAILDFFCAGSLASGADLAVGLAPESVIRRAYPSVRRTYLPFRGGRYSGCNLFAVLTRDGLAAVRLWTEVEQQRKRPWRLVAAFGLGSLALFLLRRLSLDDAMLRASARLGIRVAPVVLPFASAAIDVDKPSDLALARQIAAAPPP